MAARARLVLGRTRRLGAGQGPLDTGRELFLRNVQHRFEHAGKGTHGSILGDPARPNGEGPWAQVVRPVEQERAALVSRYVIAPGGQYDAIGDANARGNELPQVVGLAADFGDVGHA